MVKSELSENSLRGGEGVKGTAQLSAVESGNTRSFGRFSRDRQSGRGVIITPLKPSLTAHDEVESLLLVHPSIPIILATSAAFLVGDKKPGPWQALA